MSLKQRLLRRKLYRLAQRKNEAILNAGTYKTVVFTSAEGVRYFFKALETLGKDSRVLGTAQICAIGSATAKALHDKGPLSRYYS